MQVTQDSRDMGSVLGLGRSPGEGNGNPLQYSCLGNPMDRGAWWATVHGVTKSWTRLSRYLSFLSMLPRRVSIMGNISLLTKFKKKSSLEVGTLRFSASREPWERILFPGFFCVVSWGQEILDATPGGEGHRAILSTLCLWVISSSCRAFCIFCQPHPHSSPVQPSLPSARLYFLTSPNALYANRTHTYFLNRFPPAAVFPFQVDGLSIFQLFRSNTSVSACFVSLTHSF